MEWGGGGETWGVKVSSAVVIGDDWDSPPLEAFRN